MLPKIYLKKPVRLRPRHPWIYKSQLDLSKIKLEGARLPGQGSAVTLHLPNGEVYGTGYFNSQSQISVRLLSFHEEVLNEAFLRLSLQKAIVYRKQLALPTNAMRLVSSEADGLPGLIVDQYGEVLVIQILTYGMEKLRPVLLKLLSELIPNKGIYEKSDSSSRKLEGLEPRSEWVSRECGDSLEVYEGDIRFKIELGQGHKTGFYLDQRDNRLLLADLKVSGRVLDAFCFSGGFGLHLAKYASEVIGLDIQEEAVQKAEANRELNHIPAGKLSFKVANVFDELRSLDKARERFDLIVLDPPSFVKTREAVEQAASGFKEIVLRSMKILSEGGRLAVFSCSYHVDDSLLMQICQQAAFDVNKNLKVLKFLKQSVDHPINPFIPESYYLKGFLFHTEK